MVLDIGTAMADQCWDHLALDPANPPSINSTTKLKGKKLGPQGDGFSGVIHYRTGSAWRVDYRHNDAFTGGAHGDPHRVSVIYDVYRSSSGT